VIGHSLGRVRAGGLVRRRGLALRTAVVVTLAVPGVAGAQDGVFVDPDSPSGKEYAIPLEEARRDAGAQGRPDRVRPGERSAELFGAGVGDGGSPPQAGRETDAGSDRPAADGGAGSRSVGEGVAGSPASSSAPRRSSPAPDGSRAGESPAPAVQPSPAGDVGASDGDLFVVGGVGIGVLALGALIGVVGRRRLRSG